MMNKKKLCHYFWHIEAKQMHQVRKKMIIIEFELLSIIGRVEFIEVSAAL